MDKHNIFNWNHVSEKLTENQISELKALYKFYHTHLKLKCRITQKNSVKFLPAPAAFFGGVFLHTVERCSLTLERMVFLHA